MPLLDIFLTLLWFFVFIAWLWLVIVVVTDILRSPDLSGWGKALWTIFVVFVPWLGIIVYIGMHGRAMAARSGRWAFGED